MKSHDGKEVTGWENIELISDRPLEVMLKEFKQLKAEFPDRVLIASIMEECNKAAVSGREGAATVQGTAGRQAGVPPYVRCCAGRGSKRMRVLSERLSGPLSRLPAPSPACLPSAVGGADRAVPGGRGGRL